MEEQKTRLLMQLEPTHLAEEMNRGFVGLARTLMGFVDGPPALVAGGGRDKAARGARRAEKRSKRPPIGSEVPAAADAKNSALATLARTVDRAVRRGLAGSAARLAGEAGGGDAQALDRRIKDLFHEEAGRRLAAARWIRKNGCANVVPTLESVLRIEESADVRGEIERAVCVLDSLNENERS